MNAVYVLVILFGGGMDGGRAINTELRFSALSTCRLAALEISQTRLDPNTNMRGGYQAHAVCVQLQ